MAMFDPKLEYLIEDEDMPYLRQAVTEFAGATADAVEGVRPGGAKDIFDAANVLVEEMDTLLAGDPQGAAKGIAILMYLGAIGMSRYESVFINQGEGGENDNEREAVDAGGPESAEGSQAADDEGRGGTRATEGGSERGGW